MLIDTHCHLADAKYANELDAVFARAAAVGVGGFINVGTAPEDWQRCLELAGDRRDVRVALGLHPHDASRCTPQLIADLRRLATHRRVAAVGEFGLDFFRNFSPHDQQFAAFRAQLELALELGKPYVLHSRDADAETLAVLREYQPRRPRGVWHCFKSGPETAQPAAELGIYFGIGGVVTYPKAEPLRQAVAGMPAELLLLETDCPYLPPQPFRGKTNEPAYLTMVVDVIAKVRGTSAEEVARITTENARRLFGGFEA